MARAIDADAFYKQLEEIRMDYLEEDSMSSDFAARVIELVMDEYLQKQPTIEAEPVKHGKWLCKWDSRMGTTEVTCSVCKSSREILGCYVGTHGEHLYDEDDFCPKCGARMDGE